MEALAPTATMPLESSLRTVKSAAKQVGGIGSNVMTPEQADERLRDVSEKFAGFFMGMMMKMMRKTVKQSEFGHGGSGEQMFQDLADDEIGKKAGSTGAYGLADIIYQSLNRKQSAKIQVMQQKAAVEAYAQAGQE